MMYFDMEPDLIRLHADELSFDGYNYVLEYLEIISNVFLFVEIILQYLTV